MFNNKLAIILAAAISLLSGCGGGGGGGSSGPVASTSSFPLLSAMTSLFASGWNSNFTITQTGSATCNGTGNRTLGPANTSTTFNVTPSDTVSALSAAQTLTYTWSNCTPASSATTETVYYNASNYLPLGFNSVGVNYGSYLTAPVIPATVLVGGTGVVGTENLYTDSTEATSNGHIDVRAIMHYLTPA